MDRSQIADLFNVNPATVSRWRGAGCPCTDGAYDPDAVRDWLRKQPARKSAGDLVERERLLDRMCQLLEDRIDTAVLGGIIDAEPRHLAGDRLLVWDLREALRICREPGAGFFRAGVALMVGIVEILSAELGQ